MAKPTPQEELESIAQVFDREGRHTQAVKVREAVKALAAPPVGRDAVADARWLLALVDENGGRTEYSLRAQHTMAEIERGLATPAPEGGEFVLVPREPTEAMVSAGWDAGVGAHETDSPDFEAGYRAMLAAAPPVGRDAVAVELTRCCGREECGGECGNEWRGTEFVRVATPAAVSDAMVERTAAHIEMAVDYIEKAYPDARQLDRGPIIKNMRRWAANLRAALTDKGAE